MMRGSGKFIRFYFDWRAQLPFLDQKKKFLGIVNEGKRLD